MINSRIILTLRCLYRRGDNCGRTVPGRAQTERRRGQDAQRPERAAALPVPVQFAAQHRPEHQAGAAHALLRQTSDLLRK